MCGLLGCEYIGRVCLVMKLATFKNLMYLPSFLLIFGLNLLVVLMFIPP
jgi:hypothetical protein